MIARALILSSAVTLTFGGATPVLAQAAAEEAVVLSGTSAGTGRASSDLGNAVSGSINSATRQIRAIPRGAAGRSNQRRRSGASGVGTLPANSDPLVNTNAPAYRLDNGATLRVSGGLRNSAAARCAENCSAGKRSNVITVGRKPQRQPEPKPAEPATKTEATKPD